MPITLETNFAPGRTITATPPSITPLAELVGSSRYRAVSDDALKDEDNAGWLMELDTATRRAWIERISWIRVIDRLAEQELLYAREPRFQKFLAEWNSLLATGELPAQCTFSDILLKIQAAWFGSVPQPASIQAWDDYVRAISHYHAADLVIDTLDDYEKMLGDLGGSLFQVLPFLPECHRQAAQHFGVLDQFFNHLRDLREDAEQGICYLPAELLERFGVTREEILQQTACQNPGYHKMMAFWLDEYMPQLRSKAYQLFDVYPLHPSWKLLRNWSTYRYRRIEVTFRQCGFDFTQFPEVYWKQVQVDLPMLLEQVRSQLSESHPAVGFSSSISILYSQLRGWNNRPGRSSTADLCLLAAA
jgi:phytoene synthase